MFLQPFFVTGCLSDSLRCPNIILVEKDTWLLSEKISDNVFGDGKQMDNIPIVTLPKMLLATNITSSELDKAKSAGFSDTIIMKPLRASMIGACLQQALGMGRNQQQQQQQHMSNGGSSKSLLLGKKVLVVDDNRVNLRVAAGALKKFGANVECADSGKSALSKLQIPHAFDACFMDIQMPEMDGYVCFVTSLPFLTNNSLKSLLINTGLRRHDKSGNWRATLMMIRLNGIYRY